MMKSQRSARRLGRPAFRLDSFSSMMLAAVGSLSAHAVSAQTVPTPAPAASAPQAPPAVTADSSAQALDRVTITTTARKKLESVQDVPATISILSGGELAAQGVTDVRGIEYKIPGLALGDKGFDGASTGLRGVSSIRGYTGDESAVAVHLDGVYVPQSGAALGRLFDVNRIETLFGPQGSLYGRNAVAGVINVISNAPTDTFGGRAELSRGSFDTTYAEGMVNVPINADHALRFAVSGAKGDGYIKNVLDNRTFGNDDFRAGRASYRGRFGDSLTANVSFQASYDKSTPPQEPARLDDPASKTQGVGFRHTAVDVPVRNDRHDTNLAVKLDYALGGSYVLRSITGYTTYSNGIAFDSEKSIPPPVVGGGSFGYQDSRAFSQELTLISTGEKFDWRVGAYYTTTTVNEDRDQNDTNSTFVNQFTTSGYDHFILRQEGNAKAAFGTIDWHTTKDVTVSLGGRFNDETKKQSQDGVWGVATPVGAVAECNATGGGATFCHSADTEKFNWKGPSGDLTVNWQASKATMLYARAARGFRSGAVGGDIEYDNGVDQYFFGPGVFKLIKLQPEKLDSFEVGIKNTLFDRTVLFNVAAYHNNYRDQLVYTFDPVTFRDIEGNLGRSSYYGLDVNGAWVPTSSFRIDASLEYLDAEIKDVGTIVVGAKVGNKPIYAPRLSGSLGSTYRVALGSGMLSVGGDVNYKSRVYFNLANAGSQGPVALLNLFTRYQFAGNAWSVFASVNNVLDRQYFTNGFDPRSAAGPGTTTVGAPRMVRVGAAYNF